MPAGKAKGDNFAELIEQARSGSNDAARQLIARYGPHVQRTIRRTLAGKLRSQFDSQDFVQTVWASFFVALRRSPRVDHPGQLVRLLTNMARFQVIDELRRQFETQKYDRRREQPWQHVSDGSNREPIARGPSPSQLAVARERWVQLLDAQPERDRQIAQMRLLGRTRRSIARRLGLSEKTVHRTLERLLEKCRDGQRSNL